MAAIDQTLTKTTSILCRVPGISAIVLGGSRATGTAGEHSDIDIGVYYGPEMDWAALQQAAAELDDMHRTDCLAEPGAWGPWINGGGWLTVDEWPLDLILRERKRVEEIVERTDRGIFSANYQTGHPHAYLDVMYRGELASCRVLWSADKDFDDLKRHAEEYPGALKEALIRFFGFEAGFSCVLAEKALTSSPEQTDRYYLAGHLFRSVSAMNQELFAKNEQWCLNEKKAVRRVDGFAGKPENYGQRVEEIFALMAPEPRAAVEKLTALCREAEQV